MNNEHSPPSPELSMNMAWQTIHKSYSKSVVTLFASIYIQHQLRKVSDPTTDKNISNFTLVINFKAQY